MPHHPDSTADTPFADETALDLPPTGIPGPVLPADLESPFPGTYREYLDEPGGEILDDGLGSGDLHESSTEGHGQHESEDLFESEEFARHSVYEALSGEDADAGANLAIRETEAVEPGSAPPIRTTSQLCGAWSAYECAEHRMVRLRLFGKWNTLVNPATVDAWRALEQALAAAGYSVHRAWVYVCRDIRGQKTRSLHAYGLAIDIDHREPTCNVNRATPDRRAVRFSSATTKEDRCRDVLAGRADTSFTREQVAAVEGIRTIDGHQVFAWGGRWRTTKDTMHFQINVTPEELARGIRPDSVGLAAGTSALSGDALVKAMRLNRSYGQQLGWQGHVDAIVRMLGAVARLLGFRATPLDEARFAQAVAAWQSGRGLAPDGIVGPATWEEMRRVLSPEALPGRGLTRGTSGPAGTTSP